MKAYKSWLTVAILVSVVLLATTWASRSARAVEQQYRQGKSGWDQTKGAAICASGTTIYADVYNTGFEDGSPAHPFNTIQEAINYAYDGNTVLVFPGTYVENLTIIGKSLTLRSQSGPQLTIIDGNARDSVISLHDPSRSATTGAMIDGFTIRNGGGIYGNAFHGYGVMMEIFYGYPGVNISATIQNNIIMGNNLRGGIGLVSSSVNGHFEVSIINNRIIGNSARSGGVGGGITVDVPPSLTGLINVKNNVLASNDGYEGGGLAFFSKAVSNFTSIVLNNTVYSNTAFVGGGIAASVSNFNLINNIFFSNSAESAGNDLYISPPVNVSFNVIGDGQFAGTNGNISSDPLFVNPSSGDFHLKVDSPAIDAGTMVSVTSDFDSESRPFDGDKTGGAQWDIGADEYYPPREIAIYLPVIMGSFCSPFNNQPAAGP